MRSTSYLACVGAVLAMAFGGTAHGATIYGASFVTDSLYRIDTQAGTVSLIGPLGVDFFEGGLALDSTGALYGAFAGDLDELHLINTTTGAATSIGPFNATLETDVSGIAFDAQNRLFGMDADNESLLSINPATGAATVLGDANTQIPDIGAVGGMSMDGSGTLYMVDSKTETLYTFNNLGAGDATEDDATAVENLGLNRPAGMTFAMDNGETKLFVVQSGVTTSLYTFNLTTRSIEEVPMVDTLPLGIGGLAGIVPEPNTLVLLGLGGAALLRRRSR